MLAFQQTMTVPANHRLRLDVPRTAPAGAAVTVAIRFEPEFPATMRLSEDALAKDWDTPEEDAAWQNL